MGRKIVDRLAAARDPRDDEPLAEPFMRLPSRRQYPDYYVVIRRPMALSEVRNKIKQKEYPAWSDLKQDLELICTNAKRFNMRDSDIWLKARDLHSMIKDLTTSVYDEWLASRTDAASGEARAAMPAESARDPSARSHKITLRAPRASEAKAQTESPEPKAATPATPATPSVPGTSRPLVSMSVPTPTTPSYLLERRRRGAPRGKRLKNMLRTILENIKSLQDKGGRLRAEMFMELPSRDEYPDYYQFIQHPVSLAEIERKLDEKMYINAYALVTDLRIMISNAKFYNEEGSQVWNDADAIQQQLERVMIPGLLAEGFTLDPNDHRQAAQPAGTPNSVPPPSVAAPMQPAAQPAVRVAPQPTPTPATQPTPKPAAQPTPKPATQPTPKPAPQSAAPTQPAPMAPAPAPPPPPTLERVLKDMHARVWPPSPATWAAPATDPSEIPAPPTGPPPCMAVQVRVHMPHAMREISLALDRVQRHALRLPRGATRTEWRFAFDERVSEEPHPRFCVDRQELQAEWDDDGCTIAWDVQPGTHALEAQWPSEWGAAPISIYVGT